MKKLLDCVFLPKSRLLLAQTSVFSYCADQFSSLEEKGNSGPTGTSLAFAGMVFYGHLMRGHARGGMHSLAVTGDRRREGRMGARSLGASELVKA